MPMTDYEVEVTIKIQVTTSETIGVLADFIGDTIREDGLDQLTIPSRPGVKKAWINDVTIHRGSREPGGH